MSAETPYNEREKRILWRIQLIKTLPFIFLMLGLVVYQFEAIDSLERLDFSYDFSNYLDETPSGIPFPLEDFKASVPDIEDITRGEGLEDAFDFFFAYFAAGNVSETVNLTAAESQVFIDDPDLIVDIGTNLSTTIVNGSQIYLAFLNGQLDKNFLISFLRTLWYIAFESFIPERWFQNGSIFVNNNGFMILKEIHILGIFQLPSSSAVFVDFYQAQLTPNDKLHIQLSLVNLIYAIAEIALGDLIDIIISLLPTEPLGILKSFQEYFQNFFQNIDLSVKISLGARVGFIAVIGEILVDLKSILKRRFA
jgi:hypothetical protein